MSSKLSTAPSARSIALVDVDDFGRINQRLGHVAGDRLLHALAATMQAALGPRHRVIRIESDEFLLFLDATSETEASTLAEQVREAVRNGSALPEEDVTISVGVTTSRPGESQRGLMMRAQLALCWAKAAGKDQVNAGRSDARDRLEIASPRHSPHRSSAAPQVRFPGEHAT